MSIVVLAILAAAVFFVRLALRQVTRAEWGVAVFFVLHFLLIQLQTYVSESGNTFVDFRYHAPSYPLLFGWVAFGLVALIRRIPWHYTRFAVALTIVALGIRMILSVTDNGTRKIHAEIARWAADEISLDWQGPKSCPFVYQDYYRPSRLPCVAGISVLAAYYAGGREVRCLSARNSDKIRLLEMPDYIVATRKLIDDKFLYGVLSLCDTTEYECIAVKTRDWDEYRLYRRRADVLEQKEN